jgi:hypothetical protein
VDEVEVTAGTLTIKVAKEILEAVKTYLSKKKPKKTDELRKSLVKLVELSSNSSVKLRNYVSFMKESIQAGANCTDLTMGLKTLSEEDGKIRFENFITVMNHLRKEGIQAIHKYREDYEKALGSYQKAEKFVTEAKNDFMNNKKTSSNEKMQYASNELDELAMLGNSRVNDLVEELQEAYKILGQVG